MKTAASLSALSALLALAAAPACAACPPPAEAGERLDSGPVQGAWRPEHGPLAVGRPFALLVTLCPAQARLMRVDATMPEHRHGMNYRPTLTPLGDGSWRAEGLMFHMAGRWELRFDVESGGLRQTLLESVTLR